MLRTELAELVVHGFEADGVELGFEAKMADAALKFEYLQFGVGQYGGKEVRGLRGLRGRGFGGCLAHGGILFERLVVFFHFPPFLVNRGHLGLVQAGVTADQIQDALATVLVCEDLSADEHRLLDGPQIDAHGLRSGKHQRLHGLELAGGPRGRAQSDGTAAFEGKNEVVAQGPHQGHVLGRGVPTVGQQVAVGHLLLGHAQHLLQVLVFGERALVARLLGLGLVNGHRFAHQLDSDGQGQLAGMVEQADKIQALDVALLTVVPMGANQLVGVGMRLFQHRIVHDEHGKLAGRPPGLGLANQGLGLPPDVGRAVSGLAQPARDVVVGRLT